MRVCLPQWRQSRKFKLWPQGVHTSSLSYAAAITIEVPASRISALQHFHHQQTIAGRANFGPSELFVECNCIRRRIDSKTSDPFPTAAISSMVFMVRPNPCRWRSRTTATRRTVPFPLPLTSRRTVPTGCPRSRRRNGIFPCGIRQSASHRRRAFLHEHAAIVPVASLRPGAFYLKSVAPPGITLGIILRALVPFIMLQILAVALLVAFPGITGR